MSDQQSATKVFEPYEWRQIPPLYIGFAVGYMFLTALWCLNWIKHRKENIPLQKVLTIIPVAKAIQCMCAFGFYFDCVYNGTTFKIQAHIKRSKQM